jgi:hypothetical protein
MDSVASGGIGASIVVGLGVAYKLYTAVNHHRIRSTCCGKNLEASIDVDETTPKKSGLKIKVPDETGSVAEKGEEVESDIQ